MDTVVSAAWLAATRWRESATRLRARLRLRLCFFLELADAPREVVSHELLRAGEDLGLGLADGQAGDALELGELAILRLLELVLELLDVRLAVGDTLLSPLELGQAALGVVLAGVQALALMEDVLALPLELSLDVGAVLDGGLLGLELGFAAYRLGLLAGLRQHQLTGATCGGELVPGEGDEDEPRGQGPDDEADQDSHHVRHRSSSGRQSVSRGDTGSTRQQARTGI